MGENVSSSKLKGAMAGDGSMAKKYLSVQYGDMPMWKALLMELCTFLFQNTPGALGLFIRSKLYRKFFKSCGKKVVIGKNVTFRHPNKIVLGDGVILDDNSVIDAKGDSNNGIILGNGVYIGKNTIVYCKNGDIELRDKVNISANCIIFSSNSLLMQPGSMVGAYSYFLSGGEYDIHSNVPYAEQSGMETKGPLEIGENCWFGTRVTVLDAAQKITPNSVFAASAVVTKPIIESGVYMGIPAKKH